MLSRLGGDMETDVYGVCPLLNTLCFLLCFYLCFSFPLFEVCFSLPSQYYNINITVSIEASL